MALLLISGPASEPITLAEVKADLDVVVDSDDSQIAGYITAARASLDGKDGILGRALMPQTWELVFDSFPQGPINIPLPPLQSVVSIKYLTEAIEESTGETVVIERTMPATGYVVDPISEPGWIAPATVWPSTYDSINTVRIRFIAGYADAASVPRPLRLAMMLRIRGFYDDDWSEGREKAYDSLTFPYRIKLLG